MTAVDVNTIAVKRRAVSGTAVYFDGKNGREVVQFLKENGENQTRNGGKYVKVTTNDGRLLTAKKGDHVVVDADGSVLVANEDVFTLFFLYKSKG